MSLDEINKKAKEFKQRQAESGGERVNLADLPPEFEGFVTSSTWKPDARGNNCLFVDICITKPKDIAEKTVTQKFTIMHMEGLAKCLERLGFKGISDIKNPITWIMKGYPKGYPRHLPYSAQVNMKGDPQ